MTDTMLDPPDVITRREAILCVTALLGGITLVGGSGLLTGCRESGSADSELAKFAPADIAFLDEIAETILPETSTPGAKAVKTGAFMALMVKDSYSAADQRIFRDGMKALDKASQKTNKALRYVESPGRYDPCIPYTKGERTWAGHA